MPTAINDDIRLQTDSNPPDGILGGAGTCDQANEDVTVSYDPGTSSITFLDNNLGGGATVRTDAVIDGLLFVFKDVNHNPTANAANVVYIETQVTVRTRTINPFTDAAGNPLADAGSATARAQLINEATMTTHPMNPVRSEKGVALIIVLLLLAVMAGLTTGLTLNGQTEIAMAHNETYYAGARAAAEAGMNRAVEQIIGDTTTDLLATADDSEHRQRSDSTSTDEYSYSFQILDDDDPALYRDAA